MTFKSQIIFYLPFFSHLLLNVNEGKRFKSLQIKHFNWLKCNINSKLATLHARLEKLFSSAGAHASLSLPSVYRNRQKFMANVLFTSFWFHSSAVYCWNREVECFGYWCVHVGGIESYQRSKVSSERDEQLPWAVASNLSLRLISENTQWCIPGLNLLCMYWQGCWTSSEISVSLNLILSLIFLTCSIICHLL